MSDLILFMLVSVQADTNRQKFLKTVTLSVSVLTGKLFGERTTLRIHALSFFGESIFFNTFDRLEVILFNAINHDFSNLFELRRTTSTKSRGFAYTRSGGFASTRSGGTASTRSGGTASTRSRGTASTKSRGFAYTRSGGTASTRSGGTASTRSRGTTFIRICISYYPIDLERVFKQAPELTKPKLVSPYKYHFPLDKYMRGPPESPKQLEILKLFKKHKSQVQVRTKFFLF
ncbi:sporozoite surface antigen MB2 (MB2) [Brachionus plicatilis]|uniref:Sporozoite surface antigen MB2 (MB2) n=1 Tax=Brachionus plicatilis TaxID=10195 RepID=A0A3M7QTI5_BRAPC|nr:sporozoite surface antigen MB2 (MB2) [Brachionus plicatilis]